MEEYKHVLLIKMAKLKFDDMEDKRLSSEGRFCVTRDTEIQQGIFKKNIMKTKTFHLSETFWKNYEIYDLTKR